MIADPPEISLFKKSGFTHEASGGSNQNEWLTPPRIIEALGPFDLDPCAPEVRPWDMATTHYSEGGLEKKWFGRVWCNPPYAPNLAGWLGRMAEHGSGIALTFARTETKAFQTLVFPRCTAVLFVSGRLRFWTVDGREGGCAAAPSVLIAYSDSDSMRLRESGIKGAFVEMRGVR